MIARLVEPFALEAQLVREAREITWRHLIRHERDQGLQQRDAIGQGQLVRTIHEPAQLGVIQVFRLFARCHSTSEVRAERWAAGFIPGWMPDDGTFGGSLRALDSHPAHSAIQNVAMFVAWLARSVPVAGAAR